MRLRQLAISQSIVFYAPPEVHQSILNVRNKTGQHQLNSYDVVYWLLEQTCCNIEQLEPLYVSQGQDYSRRQVAAREYSTNTMEETRLEKYLSVLEQPEHYSLEQLYSPSHKAKNTSCKADGHPDLSKYVAELDNRKKNLRDTGDTVQALAHQEVEQEREVEVEVETVREVKKPSHAKPLPQLPFQRAVRLFAETGRLSAGSQTFIQAFVALRSTATGRRFGISDDASNSRLFVTDDFNNTVAPQPGAQRDQYSRSVHWILWSTITDTALVLSDFEANAVLQIVRFQKSPCTHLVTYTAPVTRAMVCFDELNFYTVPALPGNWKPPTWLVRDLGIFAGRLYFDQCNQRLCHAIYCTMGLPSSSIAVNSGEGMTEEQLWQQLPFDEMEAPDEGGKPFSKQPLLFMQEWLAVRRKGQDFSQTMMGEICRGRALVR